MSITAIADNSANRAFHQKQLKQLLLQRSDMIRDDTGNGYATALHSGDKAPKAEVDRQTSRAAQARLDVFSAKLFKSVW